MTIPATTETGWLPMTREDPIEREIRAALDIAGISYVEDPHPMALRLDFYLPGYNIHIECKQFHSDRISEQMSRAPNVIAIQGIEAAKFLSVALRKR